MRFACFPILFSVAAVLYADACDPARFSGPYAFQLSGTTTISGTEKPTTVLGRLTFDGAGIVDGVSSAMFTGLLLSNPVTGAYEVHTDCTITWKLQDDSGAYQNFAGAVSQDLTRIQFRQTDPGGAQRGTMRKTLETCSAADLQKRYTYSISGTIIPMQETSAATRTVSGKGILLADETPSLQVDADCTVQFSLLLRMPNGDQLPMKMRGYLVDGGKEILAIQTDPGAMVAGRFSSDSK